MNFTHDLSKVYLKRCPCCQEDAIDIDVYGIRCMHCGIEMPRDFGNGGTVDGMIGRWNTRKKYGTEMNRKLVQVKNYSKEGAVLCA